MEPGTWLAEPGGQGLATVWPGRGWWKPGGAGVQWLCPRIAENEPERLRRRKGADERGGGAWGGEQHAGREAWSRRRGCLSVGALKARPGMHDVAMAPRWDSPKRARRAACSGGGPWRARRRLGSPSRTEQSRRAHRAQKLAAADRHSVPLGRAAPYVLAPRGGAVAGAATWCHHIAKRALNAAGQCQHEVGGLTLQQAAAARWLAQQGCGLLHPPSEPHNLPWALASTTANDNVRVPLTADCVATIRASAALRATAEDALPPKGTRANAMRVAAATASAVCAASTPPVSGAVGQACT